MEDIIAHARELGKRIAAHPSCASFMTAARAVAEDAEAQETLKAYQEQMKKIHDMEQTGRPIEPDDKRKLAESQTKVAGNEKLKEMMKRQADYVEMMNRINQAIDEASEKSAS